MKKKETATLIYTSVVLVVLLFVTYKLGYIIETRNDSGGGGTGWLVSLFFSLFLFGVYYAMNEGVFWSKER